MRFLKISCRGTVNSFRLPEFHTYHKTLPLPPKTTIGGLIGSALGLSPQEINQEWLIPEKFKVGVCGTSTGKANDLWQIRKYEQKQIAAYQKGTESTPYKTAVIVRELLFNTEFQIYLAFSDINDYSVLEEGFKKPSWAPTLGREDELIKIIDVKQVELVETVNPVFKNTIIPQDINTLGYSIEPSLLSGYIGKNILGDAPSIYKLPIAFQYDGEERTAIRFHLFSFVGNLGISLNQNSLGYFDPDNDNYFQIF